MTLYKSIPISVLLQKYFFTCYNNGGFVNSFFCRVADKEVLQPSYDQLATAIREVQTDALVFFAAVTWDDIVPAGFTAAPGTISAWKIYTHVFTYVRRWKKCK